MSDPLFTVFTPTFDRADTLPAVRASLDAQTLRDFEWLVVDDGSRDATPALLAGWRGATGFPLRAVRQDNAGKHVAINRAVALAAGAWFVILDSDDTCVPDALERFRRHWETVPASARGGFSGVTARCMDESGRIVGDPLPAPVVDGTPMDVRYRWGVRGEMWGFMRTEVLRAHPFPEDVRGSYVPESVVWNRIGRHYRTRFVDEPLRVYRSTADESLTRPADPSRHADPNYRFNLATLTEDLDYFRFAPATFLRAAVHLVRFGLHAGRGLSRQRGDLPRGLARGLWALAVPLGWAAYRRDRRGAA